MRVTGDDSWSESRCRNRKTHDSSSKWINHKALETLAMATTAGRKPKLTCPSPTTTGARGPRFHTNWTRGAIRHARDTLRLLAKPNGRSTSCAFAFHTHTPTCQPERTTSLQSAYTDDNGTPATWTLVLFQQAIDRQDRTTD